MFTFSFSLRIAPKQCIFVKCSFRGRRFSKQGRIWSFRNISNLWKILASYSFNGLPRQHLQTSPASSYFCLDLLFTEISWFERRIPNRASSCLTNLSAHFFIHRCLSLLLPIESRLCEEIARELVFFFGTRSSVAFIFLPLDAKVSEARLYLLFESI